jgi:hypothetical protein
MLGIRVLGHRGAILLILAVIDISFGLSLVVPLASSHPSQSTIWREHYGSDRMWGMAWCAVAAVLIFYAFRRRDAIGYATAIGWKVTLGASSLASWGFGRVTAGWLLAVIWISVAALVLVISDWPEPVEEATLTVLDRMSETTGDIPRGDDPEQGKRQV